ncbi:MAG: hypothetical protein HC890_13435 [Chloroflexaceae bacterium]|nr:hypothetical protein [Chloroflexaceae bacterium]
MSVRWLLFLGLFLVVLSSGVLAATVWQYFPPVGQYAILWGYTLVFWAVSRWAEAQGNLPLTRKTLQAIAYLLIPLNFVAVDRFSSVGKCLWLGAIAAAFVSLSYLVLATARHHRRALRWGLLFLGLSSLQVGWQLAPWPITALYVGTIGVAIAVRLFPRQRESAGNLTLIEAGFAIYALAVLLIRGIFFTGLPVSDLGLAIAICGWLLVLERFDGRTAALASSRIYELVGGILLLLAWLVCFYESFPWQATAVSGLAMHWLWLRVQGLGRRRELLALFGWDCKGYF